MKKQQRTRTHLDQIELDNLGNQNCKAKQTAHIPERARSLNSIREEPYEVDESQVARNVPPARELGENINEVGTAIVKNEEISGYKVNRNASATQDKDAENKNTDNNTSGKNGEVDSSQVARNVKPIQDENGDTRNGFNRASGKNRKFDGHQVTRNLSPIVDTQGESRYYANIASGCYSLQIRCPPGRDQCNPEESTQVLRTDILDNQYLSEEDRKKVGVIANKNYFLEKCECQLKRSSELDARHHPSKLNNAQAFIRSSKTMSSREAKKHHETPEESIGVDKEYCRRDSKPRELTLGESTLKQGVVDQRHSRNIESGCLHSQGVNSMTFWLIMGALFMTFMTAALVVILWEHLSIVSLERRLCSNSSKIPIVPDIVFPRT